MGYRFEYFPNPYARRPFEFPSGSYCNPLVLEKRPEYLKIIADLKAHNAFNYTLMRLFQHNRMADVYGPLLVTLQSRWPEQTATSDDQPGS